MTTVVADAHEIANVYGREGVVYMHDAAEGLPMRQLVDIPSCVPAVPGCENAGAAFMAEDIEALAELPRAVGLAEVMDFYGVMYGEDRMMEIIEAAGKRPVSSGTCAGCDRQKAVSVSELEDLPPVHETTAGDEALKKLKKRYVRGCQRELHD